MKKLQCPKDCEQNVETGSIKKCPIGSHIPPMVVRDVNVELCPYYLNKEALAGIKKGLEAVKAGRVKPWSEVKKELNIVE